MSHLLSRHSSFHCVHYHGGGRREGGVFICYLLNNLCADIWHKLQQHTSQHIIQLRPGHEIQSVTKHWELNIQEHGQLCLLRQCWTEGNFFLGIAVNHLDISWLILVESVFFVHTVLTKKSFSQLIWRPLLMDRVTPPMRQLILPAESPVSKHEELKQIIVTTLQLFTNWIWDIIMCCKKCTVQFKHYMQNTVIRELKTYWQYTQCF